MGSVGLPIMKVALDMLCRLVELEIANGGSEVRLTVWNSQPGAEPWGDTVKVEDINKWSVRNNSSRNRAERAEGTGCC